jgi:hypothetical protein
MARIADDRYYEVGEDIVEDLQALISKYVATTVKVDYSFVGDRKLKDLIKVSKITDKYAYLLNSPVLIEVNTLLWDDLNGNGDEADEAVLIKFKEAFEGISIDEASGKAKTSNATFTTTKGVLKKYDFESVDRAHKLIEDALESIKDSGREVPQEDEIDIGDVVA